MSYSSEVLADSPLGYWRLGDASSASLADSSGNGRPIPGNAGITMGAASLLGSDSDTAASFNGTSGYARFGAYAAWMSPSVLTVEAVISTTATTVRSIVDRDSSSSTARAFQFRINGGKLEFITINGGAGVVTAASTAAVNDGKPHHVAATYDAVNIRLYIDGALVLTRAAAGALSSQSAPLAIGANFSGASASQLFTGVIDEVAYYGTALSDARIAAHYAAATAAPTPTTTATGAAPVTAGSSSTSSLTAVLIGAAPVVGGSSSRTIPVAATTGTGDVAIESSSNTVTSGQPLATDGESPVTVASSSSTALVIPVSTTTGSAPVRAASGSRTVVPAADGIVVTGTPARAHVSAIPGTVFIGTPPRVVETVRVAGVKGTTFTLPFTQPIQEGDVVVISYIGDITPLGVSVSTFTTSGLGGSWQRTSSNPLNIRTQGIYLYSTDVTTTGNATVTVDINLDPLLVGMLIRGTNGHVEIDQDHGQVYRPSGIGEILVTTATVDSPGASLDVVNYMAEPSESAWVEVAPYTPKSGFQRELVYGAPQHKDLFALFPSYTMGSNYSLSTLYVGQAQSDQILTTNPAKVQVKAPAGSVDAVVIYPALNGGGTITASTLKKVRLVTMSATTLDGGGVLTAVTGPSVVPQTGVTLSGGGTLIARPKQERRIDPRQQRPQWRYVVTDLANTALGELVDLEHDAVEDGVGDPAAMQFTVAADGADNALIRPIERQCQVWDGDVLRLRGPILPGIPSDDGTTVTYKIHDPSWFWRDGRRVITRIPQKNLLRNGDFRNALTWWLRGFDKDSKPAAAPNVRVVDEDFADDTDGLNPIKAAEIVGVESFTESELSSNAVFWPNLSSFRPGGVASVEKVADAMPTTAGLKVTVIGHTANDGTGPGWGLSLRRAVAAAAIIKKKRPGTVITTKGVGYSQPNPKYPVNSQAQRRVVIQYEQTITGESRQWIKQTVEVTQPKAARYPLLLTVAAMLKVADDWSVPDANMVSVKVVARRQGAKKPDLPWDEQLGVGSSSISDTDPIDRWIPQTAEATIPADGRPYLVDVYLYAPAALARYTAVGLFPEEQLYFWGVDQALIFKGIMEHIQDPAMGHGDLGVHTRTPRSGIKRDREFSFRDLTPADTALDGLTAISRGLEWDTLTTATATTAATFYPRQGKTVDYVLTLGGNVAAAVPANTRDIGSNVIAQAQGLGSYRAVAYARDARVFGGTLLERVITAEQDTPLNELRETAISELHWARSSTPAYWVDIDPEAMEEVLAETAKGDTVRLILDYPTPVDRLARIVRRQIHPDSLRLMVAFEEA